MISRFNFLTTILKHMAPINYYAVAKGHKPGIYNTWDECKLQVVKFPGCKFKKFSSKSAAENFIKEHANQNKKNNNDDAVCTSVKRLRSKRDQSIEVDSKKPSSKKAKTENVEKCLKTICIPNKEIPESFITDSDGYVNVYTDGACSLNGRKNARAGIGVWFGDDHPLNVSQPVVGRATNNAAEIQAVTVAAQQAKKAGIKNLRVVTDSKFLISCINDWMPKWKTNGWKTWDNKPVINKTELLKMEKTLSSLNVTWKHVNGHVGIYGNEMADKLARAGSLK